MKELNGYLEHNGLIYKIQSIEQLRDFMNGLGERAKEMTEQELASLCVNPNLVNMLIRNIVIAVACVITMMGQN